MDVDGGLSGLAQSRHHPNAGREGNNATPQNDENTVQSEPERSYNLWDEIDEMSRLLENGEDGRATLEAARRVAAAAAHHREKSNEAITKDDLRRAVREELTSLLPQPTQAKSWAAVAATATARPTRPPPEATKTVPARHLREIVVRTTNPPDDLQKRTAKEIVAAINTASGKKGAIAARRLPSGDTVITFLEEEAKEWHEENTAWAKAAFGPTGEIQRRAYVVIAKRIRAEDLKKADPAETAKEIAKANGVSVTKIRAKIPRAEDARYASMLVETTSVDQANRLCDRGLVWDAQIYQCEPFSGDLRPLQCYKCWGFGHMARWCRGTARCGRCSASAHDGGEEACPTNKGDVPKRCPACNGGHTVWDRSCPEANKRWTTAREAYSHRPTRFEIAGHGQNGQTRLPPDTALEDGFRLVTTRKRKPSPEEPRRVGRPREILRAGRQNGQSIRDLMTRSQTEDPENNPLTC
jgi:hypothetical protein